MFKKSQYLKKSAAHRQLTKLANAAQVIRVNRRLAKKAGAGMGDVVANTHSKPAAAGPQKPAPAYTPLAGRHPRRPKPVAKQPSEPIDLVIPHTNPLKQTWQDEASAGMLLGPLQNTRWNRNVRWHAPYQDWDAQPGIYMMHAPFVAGGANNDKTNKNPGGTISDPFNEWAVPGIGHSFIATILSEPQWKALGEKARTVYTPFPRKGKPTLYVRQTSSANAGKIGYWSTRIPEANQNLYWLLNNVKGGVDPETLPGRDYFLSMPGAGHINHIARVPLLEEQYRDGSWVLDRLPDESDDDYNYRSAALMHNATNEMQNQVVQSPDYSLWDANCHLATLNAILNNKYIRPLHGSIGGLKGSRGTTGSLADTNLYTPFALRTATNEEVQKARRSMAAAQRNRQRKKELREWYHNNIPIPYVNDILGVIRTHGIDN